jgi:hypothetical protein
MVILERGGETTYPVPYTLWRKREGVGNIETTMPLVDVLELTTVNICRLCP